MPISNMENVANVSWFIKDIIMFGDDMYFKTEKDVDGESHVGMFRMGMTKRKSEAFLAWFDQLTEEKDKIVCVTYTNGQKIMDIRTGDWNDWLVLAS
jgi:hypothetical protein